MKNAVITKDQANTAKCILREYIPLRFEAEQLTDRLIRMKSEQIFPAAPEDNGGGVSAPNPHRQENAIVRYMEFEKKTTARLAEIKKKTDAVERAIDRISDPLEREVLNERYIDCDGNKLTEWKSVSRQIYGDDDEKNLLAVFRLHGRALASFSVAIKNR